MHIWQRKPAASTWKIHFSHSILANVRLQCCGDIDRFSWSADMEFFCHTFTSKWDQINENHVNIRKCWFRPNCNGLQQNRRVGVLWKISTNSWLFVQFPHPYCVVIFSAVLGKQLKRNPIINGTDTTMKIVGRIPKFYYYFF